MIINTTRNIQYDCGDIIPSLIDVCIIVSNSKNKWKFDDNIYVLFEDVILKFAVVGGEIKFIPIDENIFQSSLDKNKLKTCEYCMPISQITNLPKMNYSIY